MTKVAVIILNFKVKDLAVRCIKSVLDSSFKDTEIFLVDNNSGDGIEKEVVQFPKIHFIQTHQNLGFTGGNNQGIKEALKTDPEYVLILNPDSWLEKDAIKNLVDKSKEYSADIACPKIYFEDGKTIWYAGGIFDKANVLGSHKGVGQIDKGQFDEDAETDNITGAAVLIKKEVFEKIGLFDERYFLYYEDSDFYFRAKKGGFKIMYIYSAKVFHKNAQSSGLGSSVQDYYITRNRLLFASKFLSFRTRFALLREAMRNLKNPVRRLALWDFLTGNFGKGSFNA